MPEEKAEIGALAGQVVVVDTATPFVYIGTLKEWQEHFVVLSDVDVHDTSQGHSGKDLYTLEARRAGVQRNRREVAVRKDMVVSVSRLEDILNY